MEFHLRGDSPIYLQLVHTISDAVVRGELKPGDRLPSQRDVAAKARVNPNTVQRAFMELERLGLTETRRGEGTYVKLDQEQAQVLKEQAARDAWQQFLARLAAVGYSENEVRTWVAHQMKPDGRKNV